MEIRIGLDAGEPLPDGDDLYGTPVIIASRLCDVAKPGEILASDVVRQIAGPRVEELMQPAGALRLSGMEERLMATHVRWRPDDLAAAPDPPPRTPMHDITYPPIIVTAKTLFFLTGIAS